MESLTDLAGNLDASTAQVLTALRIVATRADVEEIAEWAAKELGGYKEEEELPAHRTWKLTIKASLHNPVQGFLSDVHVGDFAIDEQRREEVTTYHCRSGIREMENRLSAQDSHGGCESRMAVMSAAWFVEFRQRLPWLLHVD